MFRQYFCQTESGLSYKDRITIGTSADSDSIVFGFESDTMPCNVYLNKEQIENLVDLLNAWLANPKPAAPVTKPVLWEDA